MIKFSLVFLLSTAAALADANFTYRPELLVSRFSSWGIDPDKHLASINLMKSWQDYKLNKDVVVAVIDSGIDFEHASLNKNIHVLSGMKSSQNYGVDFSQGKISTRPVDNDGHGSHIAGIIKSVFPEVKILSLKYYDPAAKHNAMTASIKALEYAVENNVDLINYSGGGPGASDDELKILKEAEAKGILVIVAAGNRSSNLDSQATFYPASYGLKNIISVSAHDDALNIIPSSNYGQSTVHIAAPGHRIRSTFPAGKAGYLTGTSQATAFVTGVASLIKAKYPKLNDQHLKEIILSSAMLVKNFEGKIQGSKKLDATRAIELAHKVDLKLNRKPASAIAKP